MLTSVEVVKSFVRARRGSVAIEFALILPSITLFVTGVVDIAKGVILYQEVYNAAHSIPLSASSIAVQSDRTTSLTVAQVQQALSAIYAEIPWIRSGIETGTRSVTMTSIVFNLTNSNCVPSVSNTCSYTPYVAWSVPYNDTNAGGFTSVVRPCGAQTQTSSTGGVSGSLTSLRTKSVVNPDPILVVDVHYQFTPIFFNFITGPVDFWASGYWPVRSVPPGTALGQGYTKYDIADQQNGQYKCSGYP